jgi:hypothetical protein
LNPRANSNGKRSFINRISADFVSTIIFPLIAVGDIAVQISKYPGNLADITTTEDTFLQQKIHALEAPLVVVEDALIISVPLLVVALYKHHWGKARILATVNICGLSVESVLLARTAIHESKGRIRTLLGRL